MTNHNDQLESIRANLLAGRENSLAILKGLEATREASKDKLTARELAALNRAIRTAKKSVKATEGL